MAWTKPSRNYMIVALTRDRMILDTLSGYFSAREGVTIFDLLGLREDLAGKFIGTYDIDIVFIEKGAVENGQDGLLYEIINKVEAERNGVITHFVIRYDHECPDKMAGLGNALLKKKLPVTMFRLVNKDDCLILAQSMHGIINEREHAKIRGMKMLEQELTN